MTLTMTPDELNTFRNADGHPDGISTVDIAWLVREIDAQNKRRLEQAEEIMKLQADLSTANTTIANQRAAVEQFHRDADGHNFCWVNALRLFVAFGLIAKPLQLPPLDERMHGCAKFWEELERDTGRWPDFPGFAEEVP